MKTRYVVVLDEDDFPVKYGYESTKQKLVPGERTYIFSTKEKAIETLPSLNMLLEKNKAHLDQSFIDSQYPVEQARAIKAFEAIGYKYMGLPEEACHYCKRHAALKEMPFEDVIEEVMAKHINSAEAETERTARKDHVKVHSVDDIKKKGKRKKKS